MDAAPPLRAFLGLASAAIAAGPAARNRLTRKERAIGKSKLRANRRHHRTLKRNPLPSHPVGVADLVDEEDLLLPVWEDPRYPHQAFFWRQMLAEPSLLARWTRCELYLFRAARNLWVFLVREASQMREERKAIVYEYLDFISAFAGFVACPPSCRRTEFGWIKIKDYHLEPLRQVLPQDTHDLAHLLFSDLVRWMGEFDEQQEERALAIMLPRHRFHRPQVAPARRRRGHRRNRPGARV